MSTVEYATATQGQPPAGIISALTNIVNELTGIDPADMELDVNFLEAGIDSLTLIQACQAIQERFSVKLSVVDLLEEHTTIRAVAEHLGSVLPPGSVPGPAAEEVLAAAPPSADPVTLDETPAPRATAAAEPAREDEASEEAARATAPAAATRPAAGAVDQSALERIMARQLEVMAQQLELLLGTRAPQAEGDAPEVSASPAPARESARDSARVSAREEEAPRVAPVQVAPAGTEGSAQPQTYSPYQPIEPGTTKGLTARQQEYLEQFIARYTSRTAESKRLTQAYRPVLSDSRSTVGFRLLWKEMVYPIVGQRSAGSKLWDVDGNEYVDIAMGFGMHLFGHSPDFVVEALERQLKLGLQLGPQTLLAGEVARLVCELTGMERANFCNSGTEAVMGALRLARTVTGRHKVAIFAGSYHGWSDATLAKQLTQRGATRSVPAAPGVAPHAVEDVLVLDWDDPRVLERLEPELGTLAAVLVEPVQSRRPDHQPAELLRELRRVTAAAGVALIFDEVITGFRIDAGGAQAWFGVEADLATYGKVVGGGLPVGVIAGRSKYMDAFDGGMWDYGDASYPVAGKTVFAGSFFKHPLTMAASLAVLNRLKGDPQLLPELNRRSSRFVGELNDYFAGAGLPVKVVNFGSLFRFVPAPELKWFDLFFHHLLAHGVFTWEGRTCFLSTAHTDEDLERIKLAVRRSVEEMRAADFLPPAPAAAESEVVSEEAGDADEPEPARIPLTEAQRQLWIATQMSAEASTAYNDSVTLRLRGPLNVGALREAVRQLADRHESLRSTFSPDGDCQWVWPSAELDVPTLDFSAYDAEGREAAVREWVAAEVLEPFDLVAGPLLRAHVLKLEEEYHLLVLTYHHLIVDGESGAVMLGDLSPLYAAALRGVPAELPPARPFSEFVARQSRLQQGPQMAEAESYWLGQFADAPPVMELPADRPRPLIQTYNGAQLRMKVGADLYGELKRVGLRQNSTMLMLLLGVTNVLLHRLTGQDDIVVGTPAAGQISVGAKNAVGYCVNLLPLRSRLKGNPAFSEYLAGLRRLLLEGYENQNYSFAHLVERLDLPRDPSRSPLFSVTYNFDRAGGNLSFDGLEVGTEPNPNPSARFDAYFTFTEVGSELLFECTYNTDLFDEATVRRWMDYGRRLMSAVAADPTRGLRDLPMLGEEEERRLLVEWNDTARDYPRGQCLHQLLAEQARLRAADVAVEGAGRRLTFGELDGYAERLARRLRAAGVRPGVNVGVLMERTPEMVVGLLAVLKAGGAYVPIDPRYPRERLSYMLRDSAAAVLLTQASLLALAAGHDARSFCLDAACEPDGEGGGAQIEGGGARIEGGATPDDLAYMIYTSGSTGAPKGAMITHRGLVNYLSWGVEAYDVRGGAGAPVHSSISFDLTVTSLFAPLLAGRPVRLLEEDGLEPLADALREGRGYSLVKLTPAHLEGLGQQLRGEEAAGATRALVIGGEALTMRALDFWRASAPGTRLINEYGPTETVVGCCVHEVSGADADSADSVPIGRPIANTRLFILDARMRPVAVGVVGELYVGGEGVARGYWRRPGLTAERLLPDPFSNEPGARLYRTGDRARYRADGVIEFLGRADQQVKIRGHRVEPGEIEAALAEHPGVRECVVTVREEAGGERRLAAYVVPADRRAQAAAAGRQLHRLPNGLEVAHLNRNETDYIYKEIFLDEVYQRHGVSVPDGATVFDVGANIGLFTLFAQQRWPGSRVFAFEPMPPTFDVLRANVDLYGLSVEPFNCGLSDRSARADFTFYPQMSLMSGAYGDAREEEEVTRSYMAEAFGVGEGETDDILAGRYESVTYECEVRRLSDVIRERGIERIDLLKIDAEKSELDVLRGIDAEDWPKVRQVVMEVYDKDGRLGEIRELLARHGFRVVAEQEESLKTTALYNVYAVRPDEEAAGPAGGAATAGATLTRRNVTAAGLRDYLKQRLPEYMVPASFVTLDELPLTPNGKLDHKALPAPDASAAESGQPYVAPRNEAEAALASIWAEVLGVPRVGAEDNFLDLGGHSLLAIQVISRVRQAFDVRLTVRDIFESPTVAELAEAISRRPRADEEAGQRPEEGQAGAGLDAADLDRLSEGEVDSLLKELLAEGEAK